MVECLHFFLQVLAKLRPLLPVAPLHRLHILCRRVIEIDGETLLLRLGLNLREDFRLLLGAVGLAGLFILFPQGGQYMTVLVRRRIIIGASNNKATALSAIRKYRNIVYYYVLLNSVLRPFNFRTTSMEQRKSLGHDEGGTADEDERRDGLVGGGGTAGLSGQSLGQLHGHLDGLADGGRRIGTQ